jgi:PKHD-type hydroxylase
MQDRFAHTRSFNSFLNVFTPEEAARIEALGDRLVAEKAGYGLDGGAGSGSDSRIRVTSIAWLKPAADTEWIFARMVQVARAMNEQIYQYDLKGFAEPFQYTVYKDREGGHYDWHVDQGASEPVRKLSFSVQLSDPASYRGCDLELHGATDISRAPRDRGAVIVFPSYVLHRVTPIEAGTRKSLVAWISGPRFR